MTIPAFTGLNTALRGVQAQQAALDVIVAQHRQRRDPGLQPPGGRLRRVAAAATRRRARPTAPARSSARASTSSTYRRLRDDFLDLQFRAQNMASGQSDVAAKRLGVVQSDAASGSAERPRHAARQVLELVGHAGRQPDEHATPRPPSSAPPRRWPSASPRWTPTSPPPARRPPQRSSRPALRRRPDQADRRPSWPSSTSRSTWPARRASRPTTCSTAATCCSTSSRQYGQVSVTADPTLGADGKPAYPGMIQVSFGGAATPLVSQTTVTMPTTATLSATPGGQLGGLQDVAAKVDGYRTTLADDGPVADHPVNAPSADPDLLRHRRQRHRGRRDLGDGQRRRRRRRGRRQQRRAGASAPCAAAPSTRPTPASCARSAPTSGRRRAPTPPPTASLTSITAQRQSVSGVSMDEEMANMIRFQRGYQAAARALTTMDDLLNTLINSTGRVGM